MKTRIQNHWARSGASVREMRFIPKAFGTHHERPRQSPGRLRRRQRWVNVALQFSARPKATSPVTGEARPKLYDWRLLTGSLSNPDPR